MRYINKKLFCAILVTVMFLGAVVPTIAGNTKETQISYAIAQTADFLLQAVPSPQLGSVGGEWAVIGLARSGHPLPQNFLNNYRAAIVRHLQDNNGVLDSRRHTEYSRVVLALTAAGFNPQNVAGFDLTLPLADFDATLRQGINGPIFALLAFDSLGYTIPASPNQATREMYVAEILRRQTMDGGWNLTAGINGPVSANERGDIDITGMALQALAKYQYDEAVQAAIHRALAFLSRSQRSDGGFAGGFSANQATVESSVQVLVAITELGIAIDDPRFVKNGNTLVDNILSFQNPDGGFRHSQSRPETNIMATEQALYGLVAAYRSLTGQSSLYRMGGR